jgi:hypothetical protein
MLCSTSIAAGDDDIWMKDINWIKLCKTSSIAYIIQPVLNFWQTYNKTINDWVN